MPAMHQTLLKNYILASEADRPNIRICAYKILLVIVQSEFNFTGIV